MNNINDTEYDPGYVEQQDEDEYGPVWLCEPVPVSYDGGQTWTEKLVPRGWRYEDDESLPITDPSARKKVGQVIRAKCWHPDCVEGDIDNGIAGDITFTYRYTGGAPRKYHSSKCANDFSNHGTIDPNTGDRDLTWTQYNPAWSTKNVERYGPEPIVSRRSAFGKAKRYLHQWADQSDRFLRDFLASNDGYEPSTAVGYDRQGNPVPMERRTLTPEEVEQLLNAHPYKQPKTPKPGGISVVETIIAEPGDREAKRLRRFSNWAIDIVMGTERVKREKLEGGGKTDPTGSQNNAGATREEYGSPVTADVDPEARDPMFRETASDATGEATVFSEGEDYDSHGQRIRDSDDERDDVALDESDERLDELGRGRRSGGQRGGTRVERLVAAFADRFIGRLSPDQYDLIQAEKARDRMFADLAEDKARALILEAASGSPEFLADLMPRLSPPLSSRDRKDRPRNNDRSRTRP